MKINLIKVLKEQTAKYIARMLKAPARSTYVFGQRVASKSDVRKEYLSNLRNLSEVASQLKDQEAMDYISGAIGDESEEELIKQITSNVKGKK